MVASRIANGGAGVLIQPRRAKPARMWRAIVLILGLIYVAVAWAIYLGSKVLASLLVESPTDQAILACIAVAIIAGLGIALLMDRG